ncbi:arsenate reductase ArsC [Sphingomonas parva]|uniref:Arsenate reductase ArsC n=1 Tax=Sphingomonas parva TaxID=2555898 RepID=A0A4Y8ZY22_9SPHN|nr:arsenate reductase ArsC [Sphingomonas parva]TFI59799.1 arsenate reductase ArsC [Sphingomonas parva]
MPEENAAQVYNVLFLCTGNTSRSIIAEALLNKLGNGRFHAYSAGSSPKGHVHPMALEVLGSLGFPTDGVRSKSWDEFAPRTAPAMDFVFTVCDNAAGEVCPIWPGHPFTANWGIEDPAAVEGEGQRDAFVQALHHLRSRIALFMALPIESLDALALRAKIREIGELEGATDTTKEWAQ